MRHRWVLVTLTTLSLVGMLAGCGSGQTTAGAQQPTTITFWYGLGGQLGQVVQSMVTEFNRTHPAIQVHASFQGSYSGGGPEQQKLLAAIAAGDPPDIAQLEVHSMPVFAAAGALTPLTHLMDQSHVDNPANFLPGMLVSTQYQGTYYGVPFNRSVPLLFYNATLLRQAGITNAPSTWTELARDAQRLTSGSGTGKVYGFAPLVDWWPWEASVWSGGGQILSSNLQQAVFDSPAALSILQGEQALVQQGDAVVKTGPQYWSETTDAFIHGQVAMDIDSAADIGEVRAGVGSSFHWGTALFPQAVSRMVPPGGADVVILRHTPQSKVQAAWTFIQWWTATAQTTAWSEQTGYVPVQKAALTDAGYGQFLAAHPQNKVALDELRYQTPAPASPHYLGVLQYVQQALTAAFDNNTPVSAALHNAAQESDTLLAGQ